MKVAVAWTSTLLLLLLPSGTSEVGAEYESFEGGLGEWTLDHHVWCYDEPEPCDWEWAAELGPGIAYDGAWGIRIEQAGNHDSGIVWVEREMPVPAGERVELAFWIFSPTWAAPAAWNVRAYIGTEDPESEWDFTNVGFLDDMPAWQRYCLSLPAPDSDTMWVAAGPRVAWETTRWHVLDYVSVRGATGGEPCGLLEDPCHIIGTPCSAAREACEIGACTQGRPPE